VGERTLRVWHSAASRSGNEGKIIAIDIETGDFEVDETVVAATNRLFERNPDAQPFGIRIGTVPCITLVRGA